MTKPEMKTREVITHIDGVPFPWRVCGDFALGQNNASLYNPTHDKLHPLIGESGYIIAPMPADFAQKGQQAICSFLRGWNIPAELEEYHRHVDDALHNEIISRSRDLELSELGINGEVLCAELGRHLGIRLSPEIPDVGYVVVRINRPNSTDFNPPHRDAALSVWRNTVNLWIPIAGCDSQTSLPIAAGSHLWKESDCLQTKVGGASISGKQYTVPALIEHCGKEINMQRPQVNFGEALIFTPYLLHGAAVNQSTHSRVSLELRVVIEEQNYPSF